METERRYSPGPFRKTGPSVTTRGGVPLDQIKSKRNFVRTSSSTFSARAPIGMHLDGDAAS
eukprot:5456266-Pyramimonas_sp.AAC.1